MTFLINKEIIMNNKLAIIELFEKFNEIKIPIIQRDYAQGRKSAKEIRNSFLENVKAAIDNNKELHLDFIYGSVEKKKDNKEILVLLDGQQRITTLFLLHWYAAVKDKNNKKFQEIFCYQNNNDYKSKLRYEVRPSSEEFLDYLVSNDLSFKKTQKPSEVIKDQNWFYLGWHQDPTVSGMLNMIDDINSIFFQIQCLFDELTIHSKITFDFLELNNFGLTDDLYIKMNSRGKLLTHYENFKAKLEKIIKDQKSNEFIEIAKKFDNEYTDYFWNIANQKNQEDVDVAKLTDSYLYNFFYGLTLNFYALVEDNKLQSYNNLDSFIKKNSLIFFYKDVYNEKDNNNLENLIKFLDEIVKNQDSKDYIKPIIEANPTFWDRVRFYSYFLGILYHRNDPHWYRVLKNLINNTRIDSIENYIKAIKAIKEFDNKLRSKKVLEYIRSNEKFIDFFAQKQQEEESLKARLILQDNNWENEIIEAEKNWYLDGKIGFLIEFRRQNDSGYDIESFKQYRDKFIKLWDFAKDQKEKEDNRLLLYSALLTKGDYLPEIGSNKTFCSFEPAIRAKSENWHRVFESDSRKYLKYLLDDIDLNKDLKKQLKKIIKSHSVSDWRKYFINNPDYIKYCKELQLRFDDDNKKIYMLHKTRMSGRHVELHSWHLFNICFGLRPEKDREVSWKIEGEKSCEPFKKVEYVESTSSYDEPYILLSGYKCNFSNEDYEFELKIYYEGNNKFKFDLYEKNGKDLPKLQ